jgi:hypothetical protein
MVLYCYIVLVLLSTCLRVVTAQRCRCLYGQPCWPSKAEFDTLSSKLSQPLVSPTPVASACYPGSSGNCTDVISNFDADGNWRSDQPGAFQNINFETYVHANGTIDACYLNTTIGAPCKQGNIPPLGVDARTVRDVQEAVGFARRNNLRFVVKNTGHDYLGRSAGRGAFMLWTHHLKNMTYDEDFVPVGGPSKTTYQAITLGAGVQWHEAYDFANQHGRVLVGGISAKGSVGSAGGWVMGGGHSVISPKFGLGVDNVLQFTIVLADGRHVTANAHQNTDLFWALRGGGGGTYGVVTSATYKSHPSFPAMIAFIQANGTAPEVREGIMTEFIRSHTNLSDAGWGGYFWLFPSSFQGLWLAPNVSQPDMEAALGPFVQHITNITGGQGAALYQALPSYHDLFTTPATPGGPSEGSQVGSNEEIASRLLSRELAQKEPNKIAKILLSVPDYIAFNSVGGGAVNKVTPSSTGLNPSWRQAVSEVHTTVGWEDGATAEQISQQRGILKNSTNILDKITTDSGSYLNEGSLYEKDWKKSYFGSHYRDLTAIKRKFDPTSLFVVISGVGSDEWDHDLVCRR